jgi:hypothetical protein
MMKTVTLEILLEASKTIRKCSFSQIFTPAKKPATVTRQLTKYVDFRQNYLCDFHLSTPLLEIVKNFGNNLDC